MLSIITLVGLAAAPVTIDYVSASSTLGAVRGTWNNGAARMFDGREDTAWCAAAAAREERVGVEFSAPVRIDSIRITLGDPKTYGGFGPAIRPEVITLSNMSYVWQIIMPDDPSAFDMPLPPPITGKLLIIRFDQLQKRGKHPLCVAEVTLFQGGEAIELVRAAGGEPSIEGIWVPVDAQSPERFVVFYRDGRLRVRDHPDWSGPMPDRLGRWTRQGKRLSLILDGRRSRFAIELAPNRDGRIRLTGEQLLVGTWVPWVPNPTFRSALW